MLFNVTFMQRSNEDIRNVKLYERYCFMAAAPQQIHMVVAPRAQRPRLALCRSRIRSEVRPASAEHEEGFGCGTVQRLHRRRRLAHSKKCSTTVRCADTRRHRSHSSEQQQFRCADTRRHSSHIHKRLGEVFRSNGWGVPKQKAG